MRTMKTVQTTTATTTSEIVHWFRKISKTPEGDLEALADALVYFESEYEKGKKDLNTDGRRIEDLSKRLAGYVEHRFGQLQEIESILRFFEIRAEKAAIDAKRRYLESYQRQLSDRTAEKFGEADDEVIALRLLLVEISRVRNLFVSLSKGLETLHFQLSNIVKLRVAQIEDATL